MKAIFLSYTALDPEEVYRTVQDKEAGGIATFIGTVRDRNEGKEVIRLEYSAYEAMARKEMEKILSEAQGRWGLKRCLLAHRLGTLALGDIAVMVGVSAAHRKEAFEACAWIMDTLKKTVPIWKKEHYRDGSEWLNATP